MTQVAPKSNKPIELGKVLVVGGNGFLGHHIVKLALDQWSAQISSVDLRCDRNRFNGVTYHEANITDAAKLQSVFNKVRPDVVIHTASPAAQGEDQVAKDLFQKVNVEGTKCVIEACQKAGVKVLVFTSSASILSDNSKDLINASEEWPVIRGDMQTQYYSETKAEAEELVLKANRQSPYKLLTCAIRPSAIFGEGDGMTIKHMIQIYRDKRNHFQVGDNNNLFDFTYAANVAHAHLLAARLLLVTAANTTTPLDTGRIDGEAFLVTNDSPIYFWDFCRAVWKYAGSTEGTEGVWTLPREVGIVLGFVSEVVFSILRRPATFNRQRIIYSSMTRYFNIGKARTRLAYRPIVTLDEGIRRSVKWFLDEEAKGAIEAK